MRWMDGEMDGWMVRWMDGLMDGWMDRLMDGWIEGWMISLSFLPSIDRSASYGNNSNSDMLEINIDTMFNMIHPSTSITSLHTWSYFTVLHYRDRLIDEEISSRILRTNRRLIQQELRRAHLKHTPGD